MISAIEDIIFKLSGIALTMLQNTDSDPLQVRFFPQYSKSIALLRPTVPLRN